MSVHVEHTGGRSRRVNLRMSPDLYDSLCLRAVEAGTTLSAHVVALLASRRGEFPDGCPRCARYPQWRLNTLDRRGDAPCCDSAEVAAGLSLQVAALEATIDGLEGDLAVIPELRAEVARHRGEPPLVPDQVPKDFGDPM